MSDTLKTNENSSLANIPVDDFQPLFHDDEEETDIAPPKAAGAYLVDRRIATANCGSRCWWHILLKATGKRGESTVYDGACHDRQPVQDGFRQWSTSAQSRV